MANGKRPVHRSSNAPPADAGNQWLRGTMGKKKKKKKISGHSTPRLAPPDRNFNGRTMHLGAVAGFRITAEALFASDLEGLILRFQRETRPHSCKRCTGDTQVGSGNGDYPDGILCSAGDLTAGVSNQRAKWNAETMRLGDAFHTFWRNTRNSLKFRI